MTTTSSRLRRSRIQAPSVRSLSQYMRAVSNVLHPSSNDRSKSEKACCSRRSTWQPWQSPAPQSIGAEHDSRDRLINPGNVPVVHSVRTLHIVANDEPTRSNGASHHRERGILKSGGDKARTVGHVNGPPSPISQHASGGRNFPGDQRRPQRFRRVWSSGWRSRGPARRSPGRGWSAGPRPTTRG